MKRALELLKNLFKALIFWFFFIKKKEQEKGIFAKTKEYPPSPFSSCQRL
jgi:hypothetical protein